VGNASPGRSEPFNPLSSQSGQGASPESDTATHSSWASAVPDTAPMVPSENAATTWSPARRSIRSLFHSRKADPTWSATTDSSAPSSPSPASSLLRMGPTSDSASSCPIPSSTSVGGNWLLGAPAKATPAAADCSRAGRAAVT